MDLLDQLHSLTAGCLNHLRPRRHRLLDARRRRRHLMFPTGTQAHLRREKRRLRAHFRSVLAELRLRDVSGLSPERQAARARLLEALTQYARTGRFPRNFDFPATQMPYFVDAFGTRCAMAHLIESTGEIDLVARVAQTANNAFVRELESDDAFRAWLDANGLTAAEAARIQPSYCFVTKAENCICSRIFTATDAVVEATITSPIVMGKGTIRIDAVHGDTTLAMVGQEVEADFNISAAVDTPVLGSIAKNSPNSPFMYFQLTKDDHVVIPCSTTLTLTTQQVVDAIMSASCTESLTKVDSRWNTSICEGDDAADDGGCAIAATHGFSPLVFAPVLVAAAFTARRRARRRIRK